MEIAEFLTTLDKVKAEQLAERRKAYLGNHERKCCHCKEVKRQRDFGEYTLCLDCEEKAHRCPKCHRLMIQYANNFWGCKNRCFLKQRFGAESKLSREVLPEREFPKGRPVAHCQRCGGDIFNLEQFILDAGIAPVCGDCSKP